MFHKMRKYMMKKNVIKKLLNLGLLAIVGISSISANNTSRSFFSIRPYTTPISSKTDNNNDKKSGFEATVFGGVSTNSTDLAKYFFFGGKTTLTVNDALPAGVIAAELSQNIISWNFNVGTAGPGTFQSTLSIKPQHTFAGATFSYKKYLKNDYWIKIELPLLTVKNNLNFKENILNANGGAFTGALGMANTPWVGTMKEAFKQPAMQYGKINGAQRKSGAGDLTFKLGYDSPHFNKDGISLTTYVGLVLPTSNKAKAVYVFEPILGNGSHAALQLGSHGQVELSNYKNGVLWMSWSMQAEYLFQNAQKRSFDLKRNGPWSRYLSLSANETQRQIGNWASRDFGINLLTLDAKVTPGYQSTLTTALSYKGKRWNATLGYATHIRHKETIMLKRPWKEGPMVTANATAIPDNINPFHGIGTELDGVESNADDDAAASLIKQIDIDLNSAAHPGNISHTLSLSCSGDCTSKKPSIFEAGASYEFGKSNTVLHRFGAWATIQVLL